MRQIRANTIAIAVALGAALTLGATVAEAHWRITPRRVVVVTHAPRPMKKVVVVAGKPAGVVDFNVKPKATEIFVNGSYRGTCDEFDGHPQKMVLKPGTYHIRLVTPDGNAVERKVSVRAGYEVEINLKLQ